MADRKLVVAVIGDDRSFQQALTRSTASAEKFGNAVKSKLGTGVSVGGNFKGLLDDTKAMRKEADLLSGRLENVGKSAKQGSVGVGALAGAAGPLALGFAAAFQGSQALANILEQTGAKAFTTSGRVANLAASLARLDVIGGLRALSAAPKTFEDLGISVLQARNALEEFDASGKKIADLPGFAQGVVQSMRDVVAAQDAATNSANALADAQAKLGQAFRDSAGNAVTFKGAVDDLGGLRGPGLVNQINTNLEANQFPQFPTPQKPIGPTAKNQAAQAIAQANGDLEEVLRLQVQARDRLAKALAVSRGNVKQREALNQQLAQATAAVITTQRAIAAQTQADAKAAATARASRIREHWDTIIGALTNAVSAAELTPGLNNDLKALQALKAGLERQIKAGVDVQSAQSQLIATTSAIADKQADIRAAAARAVQAQQFRALGLTGAGEEVVPQIANLRKRLNNILSKIDSGDIKVGSKLLAHLKAASKQIETQGKNLTETTRKMINDFIKAANGDGKEITGPITKGSGLNTKKFLAGLGLDPEEIRQLRSRLSGVNSSGLALASVPKLPTGNFATPTIVVENHNTTTLDGEVVARSVTKSQQITKRRNRPQKRGPNRSGI